MCLLLVMELMLELLLVVLLVLLLLLLLLPVWWHKFTHRIRHVHLLRMHPHVNVQIVQGGEHFVTLVALVALVATLFQMHLALVCHHVTVPAEAFRTYITVIVFDARV